MAERLRKIRSTSTKSAIAELETQIERLITEQRSLNRRAAALQRRNLRLEELNDLKDEFIAVASHQLRTPATAVKQYLGLLLEGYTEPLSDSQKIFLERAFESNERQLKIVDDLLRIARVDSENFKIRPTKLEIRKVIQSVVDELADKLKSRHQTVVYDLPKKKIPVLADRERITMVFENLIDNACNYSSDNTSIRIKLRSSKGFALIDFQDQGVGIDRRDFPRLFQKFSRIPNPRSVEVGGTGLGLYWADRVVRLHGGKILVESNLQKGSTFTVALPISTT
jgi:two-component system sensor histidine kinase VicK